MLGEAELSRRCVSMVHRAVHEWAAVVKSNFACQKRLLLFVKVH